MKRAVITVAILTGLIAVGIMVDGNAAEWPSKNRRWGGSARTKQWLRQQQSGCEIHRRTGADCYICPWQAEIETPPRDVPTWIEPQLRDTTRDEIEALRYRLMMTAQVDEFDPSALLAIEGDLRLDPGQRNELVEIQLQARRLSSAVLNDQQRTLIRRLGTTTDYFDQILIYIDPELRRKLAYCYNHRYSYRDCRQCGRSMCGRISPAGCCCGQ